MTRQSQIVTSFSRIWLILWLVAIPLIHVHPEADHAHGAQDHKHGGLFHSVFSQDLACEFHIHTSASLSSVENNSWDLLNCEHVHAHLINHEEIGFSILSDSHSDPSPNHESPISFIAAHEPTALFSPSLNHSFSLERSPPTQRHVSLHRIRPPPTRSS